ncbi:peptidoglycan DD-metalloendopeptidase family protein [Prescottella equi]|uniref:Putative M23 family peptidase/lytic transglycosylase n=1 Tax=Rhodococcus hoagii TaxID=43767 RepID=B4F389_RHOHA|nr:M23 family metallopeptidase [Prescottella equi]ARX59543.1 putative M23 family peptidase/lytic transglycosylase [Prescottella equi]ARX60503.1 putative M23 family peptidase/lytic transglycosylase [Prescottella equi]ARX60608.1 putative M23 family peptidase/lytic transglycosylase [Prescottella equi]CAQ30292.1 putative M23 family peptidase/lytic transglycosylase [Prescottella equi]
MNDKGGTGLIAVILAVVLVPFMLILLLMVGIQDEEDQQAATNCLGPTSTVQGGDRLAPLGSFIKPVDPSTVTLTSGFGARWGEEHKGIDLAGDIGTPIYAAADGTVRNAGEASGFGQWVVLDHVRDGQLVATVYGHIDTYSVEVGQQVRAGQQIATIGNRGQSTGPHLHWEVWPGGWGTTAVDPEPYYDSAPAPGAPAAGDPTAVPNPPSETLTADLSKPLPASAGSETNMQVDTKKLIRALHAKFGDRISTLGGWRADGGGFGDHPEGRAIDAMIPDYRSGAGVQLGNEILDYVMANAEFFNVEYAIWRQTYYPAGGGTPNLMEDRGSENENHYNHVHITVNGQGFNEAGFAWGSAPGGGGGSASATAADCVISGEGLGDSLAPGSVPPEFAPWLERAGRICPQIKPSLLAAQIEAEGNFQQHGYNSAGASGYTQFIDSTWNVYGYAVDDEGRKTGPPGSGDRNKVSDAVMAQGNYMCTIANKIDGWITEGKVSAPNGRTELYLAGYNAGEYAVLESGGFPTGATDYVVQTRPYADKIIANEAKYRSINQ